MCFVVHGWVPNTKKSNTRPALPHYSNPPVLPGPGYVELAVTAWGPQVWPCWTAWWLLVPGWDFLYHPGLSSRFFFEEHPNVPWLPWKSFVIWWPNRPGHTSFVKSGKLQVPWVWRTWEVRCSSQVLHACDKYKRLSNSMSKSPRVACWNPRKWNLKESESWWWFTTFLDSLSIQGWIELLTFPGSGSYKKWKPQRVWKWGISIPIACNFRTSCRW